MPYNPIMRGAAWLAIVMMAACGADEAEQLDGARDAPDEDAAIDAAVDTTTDPMPWPDCEFCDDRTFGRISLTEVDQLDPLGDGSHGQGLIGSVHFRRNFDGFPDPVRDDQPGTPFGCKTWMLTRAQAAAMIGIDEGAVQFMVPGPNPPAIEPCTFASGTGYTCPGATAVTLGLADPGMLPDVQTFEAALTSGGGNHVPSFVANSEVGDDFTLTPESLALLENLPRDGSPFTVACDASSCPSGSGIATELEIMTTDAAVSGLSPFDLPLPTNLRVWTRCTVLDPTSATITVLAPHAAYLMGSNATRIRATFRRLQLAGPDPPVADVLVMAGHAITGITNSN